MLAAIDRDVSGWFGDQSYSRKVGSGAASASQWAVSGSETNRDTYRLSVPTVPLELFSVPLEDHRERDGPGRAVDPVLRSVVDEKLRLPVERLVEPVRAVGLRRERRAGPRGAHDREMNARVLGGPQGVLDLIERHRPPADTMRRAVERARDVRDLPAGIVEQGLDRPGVVGVEEEGLLLRRVVISAGRASPRFAR